MTDLDKSRYNKYRILGIKIMGKKYELGNMRSFMEITVPDGMELIIDNNGQARVVSADYSVEAVSENDK